MRHDFELIRAAAAAEKWTDETPVPPEFFGALWPFGVPNGWPKDEKETRQEMLIELVVPEDISDEDLDALVLRHVLAADELHAAAGGSGLRVDAVEVYREAPVLVPEGVPS